MVLVTTTRATLVDSYWVVVFLYLLTSRFSNRKIPLLKKTDIDTIQRSIVHHVTTTLARAAYNMDNFTAYQAVALRYGPSCFHFAVL
jgi:hypothetical protein